MSDSFTKRLKKELYPISRPRIRFKTDERGLIRKAFHTRSWKESEEHEKWDLFWSDQKTVAEIGSSMEFTMNQRANHFLNSIELTKEHLLLKNIKESYNAGGNKQKAEFIPASYFMPQDYQKFIEVAQEKKDRVWVIKPVNEASETLFEEGFGLLNQCISQNLHPSEFEQTEEFYVQEYLKNPLLIGGKQFKIQTYCFVKSFSPFTAYLYRDGFAKFEPVNLDQSESSDNYVTINNNIVFLKDFSTAGSSATGSNNLWSLRNTKNYLISRHGKKQVEDCFLNIQKIIIKSLQSVQKVITKSNSCFELFEIEIVLDTTLKPWLRSINTDFLNNETLTNQLEFKSNILDDTCTLLDMEKILTGREDHIGGFYMLPRVNQEDLLRVSSNVQICMLGLLNNREEQLKKLVKGITTRMHEKETLHKEEYKSPRTTRIIGKKSLPNSQREIVVAQSLQSDTTQHFLSQNSILSPSEFSNTSRLHSSSRRSGRGKTTPLPKITADLNLTQPEQRHENPKTFTRMGSLPLTQTTMQTSQSGFLPMIVSPSIGSPTNEFGGVPNTPKTTTHLPPIFPQGILQSQNKERLKTKLELLLDEALPNPVSLADLGSPSTAASFKEGREIKKAANLDSEILKALHKRSGLKRESSTFRIKNGAGSHFKKEDIRKLLLKRGSVMQHVHTENLDEIEEEDEYGKQNEA